MNQYANDFTRTTQIYYDDLKKYKPLTKSKEKHLLRLCRSGNTKAKNELLEANLKFVFDIAKHYTGRGLSISDLISEGNMGLLRAVDKFDESKDVKFISYAVWWIRQAMLEAISKKRLIMVEIDPTRPNDEIFERNVSDDEDERLTNGDTSFSNEKDEEKKQLSIDQKEAISRLLKSLNTREREIIESYYGLGDSEELTLTEIGKKYNLSSERVRQIKLNSIRKLRSAIMMDDNMEELRG